MREIALHLLDIAENSVAAGAKTIAITVCEDLERDRLSASVQDDGRGMDTGTAARIVDPFVTSRTTRKVGLGIPLLKAAAEACSGGLVIRSAPGEGTCLEVVFQRSHIDRMPLGDLAGTFLSLVVAYPRIRWILSYQVRSASNPSVQEFTFDSQPVREIVGDVPFSEPDVLAYLRTTIEQGIASVQNALLEKI